MSTNGAIARETEDGGWAGTYHHWDSYPAGLGAALYKLAQTMTDEELVRVLIEQHPAGWSAINGEDFKSSVCYCHWGSYDEGEHKITSDDVAYSYIGWVYIIGSGRRMRVLKVQRKGELAERAVVRFDGPEPNWYDIDY